MRIRPTYAIAPTSPRREVAWSFGMRRIRARYKQAVFGFLWAIIQPLAFLGLFLVFLAPDGDDGNFAAGTFAALVSWQFVNSAVSGGGPSLLSWNLRVASSTQRW